MPKPKVFGNSRSTRCMLCLDKEMLEWIKSSLDATLDEGFARPSISRVHKELVSTFGDRAPRVEGSVNRHLSVHEPAGNGWCGENY